MLGTLNYLVQRGLSFCSKIICKSSTIAPKKLLLKTKKLTNKQFFAKKTFILLFNIMFFSRVPTDDNLKQCSEFLGFGEWNREIAQKF